MQHEGTRPSARTALCLSVYLSGCLAGCVWRAAKHTHQLQRSSRLPRRRGGCRKQTARLADATAVASNRACNARACTCRWRARALLQRWTPPLRRPQTASHHHAANRAKMLANPAEYLPLARGLGATTNGHNRSATRENMDVLTISDIVRATGRCARWGCAASWPPRS